MGKDFATQPPARPPWPCIVVEDAMEIRQGYHIQLNAFSSCALVSCDAGVA